MIISASRRTDIPAFYPDWLLNRLRAGFVYVRNPRNRRQVVSVDLRPPVVDCIVFWTKNAGPLLAKLATIEQMGYPYYFQYTLTPYDRRLEPGLDKTAAVNSFMRLGDRIGPQRLIWRYDPVIINSFCTVEYHFEQFGRLCSQLSGYTVNCVISFVDWYRKLRRRTEGMIDFAASRQSMVRLTQGFASIAAEYRLRLSACAEADLGVCGLTPAACIDQNLIEAICSCRLRLPPADALRSGCRCAASIDIGAYDSCGHGCLYCYATTDAKAAAATRLLHDPHSPLLAGSVDVPVAAKTVKSHKIAQTRLF
ncbi:MAG: DUF1848 domain-containing protein [Sporomusaceae bacterium]|nr:DUF1848 domain-containing protein [Sporomusaceae bacterium]